MTLQTIADIAARYDTVFSWAMLRALLDLGVSVRLPRTRRHARDHARAYEVTPEEAAWCMSHNKDVIGAVR